MSAPLSVALDFGTGTPRPVGRLAVRDRRVFFEWDAGFLADPLPLSPFHLAPRRGVVEGPRIPFEGLHGLFADSMPDAWGRLLIDRALRREGRDPARLTPLDHLAMVGAGGAGALVYRPDRSVEAGQGAADLDALARDAEALLSGDDPVALDRLRQLGGSSGGARPKALLWRDPATDTLHGRAAAGREAWIVKFRGGEDPAEIGAIEHAYAQVARAAGLEMAETRLFPSADGPGWFGTRRFDRQGGGGRLHMHSLAGLLQADYRIPSVGYDALVRAARLLTRSEAGAEAAFRLMVFNIAVHNRDDHAKNVAFLMDASGEWRLAPAFDLTFAEGPGGEHAMDVAGEGRAPGREDVLRVADAAGLRPRAAARIIDEVGEAVSTTAAALRDAGVGPRWRGEIAGRLATTLFRKAQSARHPERTGRRRLSCERL